MLVETIPSFLFVNCIVCSWFMVRQQPTTFNRSYRRLVAFHNFSCKNCITLHTIAIQVRKTISALQSCFWWPKLPVDVKHFVSGCKVCQKVKDINQYPQGLLQPLPIPTKKFDTVAMNFNTSLPECNGKNALIVCCNKFGKLTRLVPTWVGENH